MRPKSSCSFASTAQTASTRTQSINNLKQIGLAFHNFAASNNHLPPPVLYGGKSGKVPYSWRVALLPYLEQQDLYNSYNFDEPWDGPSNSKLLDKMPAVYGYPRLGGTSKTHAAYFVFTGEQTMLGKGAQPSFMDITDGMSNTILAVEAQREIPWTKPEDIPFDPQLPLPQIGGFHPDGHQHSVWRRLGPLRQANHQSDCFEGTDHASRRRSHKFRFVLRQTVSIVRAPTGRPLLDSGGGRLASLSAA